MQPNLADLGGAIEFNNISSSLEAHVREAARRGWAQPHQLAPPAEEEEKEAQQGRETLSIKDMWPYWLDGGSLSTVHNTLDLDSMVILTGPPGHSNALYRFIFIERQPKRDAEALL